MKTLLFVLTISFLFPCFSESKSVSELKLDLAKLEGSLEAKQEHYYAYVAEHDLDKKARDIQSEIDSIKAKIEGLKWKIDIQKRRNKKAGVTADDSLEEVVDDTKEIDLDHHAIGRIKELVNKRHALEVELAKKEAEVDGVNAAISKRVTSYRDSIRPSAEKFLRSLNTSELTDLPPRDLKTSQDVRKWLARQKDLNAWLRTVRYRFNRDALSARDRMQFARRKDDYIEISTQILKSWDIYQIGNGGAKRPKHIRRMIDTLKAMSDL